MSVTYIFSIKLQTNIEHIKKILDEIKQEILFLCYDNFELKITFKDFLTDDQEIFFTNQMIKLL